MSLPASFRLPRALLAAGLLPLVILAAGCTASDDEQSTADESAVPDSVNTLTDAEQEDGWQLLFDGATLDGWRGFKRDSVPAGWTVDEGALHFTTEAAADDEHSVQTLITSDTYDHFELRAEWKLSPEGNSGILYRVTEEEDLPYETGLEYQIVDDTAIADEPDVNRTGGLFGLYAPSEDVVRPIGEYNETRIVVRGNRLEHWLNGTKLLDAEIGSDTWNDRVSSTKFSNWPNFAAADAGHIALQDHGYRVWYRDLKIRPLRPEAE